MASFWNQLQSNKKPFLTLAPLDGVTDYAFREIIAETAKPDVLFTEFTNVDALASKGRSRVLQRFKFSEKQRYIVAQIWGKNPENFYKAAQLINELGFDGIDINMGCPVKAVMKAGAGAAHIKDIDHTAEIIAATRKGAGKLPVSVKTRIGIDSIITEVWTKFLLEQNLDAITIHGRTSDEMSKVPAHWDEIAKVVKIRDELNKETVVLGNGDINSYEQAVQASQTYGVDGVMIGRGIFSNPWIFEGTPTTHTSQDGLELLLKHTKLYCETYPEAKRFGAIKKFFKIYVKSFRGADNLKKQLMETNNYEDVENLIKPFL